MGRGQLRAYAAGQPRTPGLPPAVRPGGCRLCGAAVGRRVFAQIGSATNVINMTPPLSWLRQLSASFYVSPIDTHHPPTPPPAAAPPRPPTITAGGGVGGRWGAADFRANRLCDQCHQHDATSVLVAPAICKLLRFSDRHAPPFHTAHHCRPDTLTPCNSPGWCGRHDRLSSGAAALARRGHGAGLAAKRAQLEGPGPGVPCSYKCWPRELPRAFSNEAPELSLAITTLI